MSEVLDYFVAEFTELVDAAPDEAEILDRGSELLAALVADDDWLPPQFAEADPGRYRQYLLHRGERFSVVSFVWGPGQSTPVHDHRTWGLGGVLRGAERNEGFARDAAGQLVSAGVPQILGQGAVARVSPTIGDVHRVANAHDDSVSISIHVYGGDIGRIERSVYGEDGSRRDFVSGYSAVA